MKSNTLLGSIRSMWRAMTGPAFDFQGDPAQQGGALILGPGKLLCFVWKLQFSPSALGFSAIVLAAVPVDLKETALCWTVWFCWLKEPVEVSLCSPTSHSGGTKLITTLQKSIGVLMEQLPRSLEGFFWHHGQKKKNTYIVFSLLMLGIYCCFSGGIMNERRAATWPSHLIKSLGNSMLQQI